MSRQFSIEGKPARNVRAIFATIGSLLMLAIVGGGLLYAVVFSSSQATQKEIASTQKPAVNWDDSASRELEAAYHKLHEAWNAVDVDALKRQIVGDDVLATFDNDPETSEPVKLTSKAEIERFTEKIFNGFKNSQIKSVAEHPMIRCRATSTLGICTEECKVQLYAPDGSKQVHPLRATAVAAKYPEGWRFIQWHMSSAGAPQKYDKQGKIVENLPAARAESKNKTER